jgi:hypothetical protein
MAVFGLSTYGLGSYYGTVNIGWLATLPQKLLQDGFADEDVDYVLMTDMDAPVPKLRKRFTSGIRRFGGKMILTPAEKSLLRDFYKAYCAFPFFFPDPDTGENITVIFVAKPSYESAGGEYQYVTLKFAEKP